MSGREKDISKVYIWKEKTDQEKAEIDKKECLFAEGVTRMAYSLRLWLMANVCRR